MVVSFSPSSADIVFLHKDIFDPALLAEEFDLCIAALFLHEFPPEKAYRIFNILLSLVRPGGYLAVIDFIGEWSRQWRLASLLLSAIEPLPNRQTMVSVLPFIKNDARLKLVARKKFLAGIVTAEILQKKEGSA